MDQAVRKEPTLNAEIESQPEVLNHNFSFSGTAGEYFRIWIVNVALSILTLGIYSAWATVRTRRYFYANTRVANAPFEYSARPLPILLGRLIAFTVFALYVVSEYFFPLLTPALFLAVACLVPALLVRSLRFRARYSSWRGVRFRFNGSYAGAYKYYLFSILLVILTLGLAYPLIKGWQKRYLVGNHSFGTHRFEIGNLTRPFYETYLIAWGSIIGMLVGVAVLIALAMLVMFGLGDAGDDIIFAGLTGLMGVAFYLGAFLIGIFVYTRITNTVYNNTRLDAYQLRSSLRTREMAWLLISNALAVSFSLGLAIPWARVRMARYRASCLALVGPDDFEHFAGQAAADEQAIGAEVGDVLDVDIGL
ncbi:DUF898 domain-containing protein [Wenzhouxiangella sp. AB-CW3]|uniref:YjgN family protein n=1 Tax=Wenzhouxiangella sp. AB-CW3 TaxID=2771012 RepID=UPI00168AB0E2|nr:YjgN family protein [Wenzhouxiangella sp. AB-CW3]QOC21788.1 DUF898 domain-containing protein [Wenzhouxiangella sp. AB-CW3]